MRNPQMLGPDIEALGNTVQTWQIQGRGEMRMEAFDEESR